MSCGVFRLFGPVFMRRGATYNASSTSGQSPSTLRCPPFQTFFSFLFGFPPFSCSFFLCVFVPRCFFLFPSSLFFFFFLCENIGMCVFSFSLPTFFPCFSRGFSLPFGFPPFVCVCVFSFFLLFFVVHTQSARRTLCTELLAVFFSLSRLSPPVVRLSPLVRFFFFSSFCISRYYMLDFLGLFPFLCVWFFFFFGCVTLFAPTRQGVPCVFVCSQFLF